MPLSPPQLSPPLLPGHQEAPSPAGFLLFPAGDEGQRANLQVEVHLAPRALAAQALVAAVLAKKERCNPPVA